MSSPSLTDSTPALAPVSGGERIQALDVVRGFALIGIFLMNIEFFNRPLSQIGSGLPATLQGADWWAGYLVYVLVQGKFWTMFSLLFGMGFAVMLTRAERAGRGFLVPYIRRIAALAVFGTLHHVFLWGGDILFSYSVGALCLLLLLWAPWAALIGGVVVMLGLGFVPGMQWSFEVCAALVVVLLGAWFLRGDDRIGQARLTWQTLFFFVVSALLLALAALAGNLPNFPADARWPLLIPGLLLALLGVLATKYKDPAEPRMRRLGGTLYVVPFLVMLSFGLLQVFGPDRLAVTEAQVAAAAAKLEAAEAADKAGKADTTGKAADSAAAAKDDAKPAGKLADGKAKDASAAKAKPDPVEAAAQAEAQRRKNRAEHEADVEKERALVTAGGYAELVRFRAKEFGERIPGEFGFAVIIIGMFLLGAWFVRSGIMEDTRGNLPLFRRMALFGIPLGVGAGIAASFLSTHVSPGVDHDPYQVAMAITMLGNLPACLGYVGLVVLMLHSQGPFSRIAVLAPLGRMALTNYLTHSLLCGLLFYGYGAGWYGMARAPQVGFVFVVIALQVLFCTWWLKHFRYGPMEWLWRAITYWQLPAMRRDPAGAVGAAA